MPVPTGVDLESVNAVRAFNRFYTRRIGVLQERPFESPFSLTEVRILYEIAHCKDVTAAFLCKQLGLDAGYVSRTLRRLEERRLIQRATSISDARQSVVGLTRLGQQTFAALDAKSSSDVGDLLNSVPPTEQPRLVGAMRTIQRLLGDDRERQDGAPYLLRPHQPGDMGWVAHRHGVIYAREYGYDERFEGLVAKIVAEFIEHFDPKYERCWIAERDGDIVGSVFLVKEAAVAAKLRLLYVEPAARGLGIGKRLVEECLRFARQARYKTVHLWTQSELTAARQIYQKAGFQLVRQDPHHNWGRDLVSETWEITL